MDLPSPHHLRIARTARYYMLGDHVSRPREIWFVLHGYGQLAGRFIRHFAPLDDGTRVIVAPEGLSRFYLEHPGRAGSAHTRVGATWMTREDRAAEIADHVAYLDALHDAIGERLDGAMPPLHVLGFSQGVATATRWLAQGRTRADRLVVWAGRVPADVFPLPEAHPLRALRVDVVTGDADEFATTEVRDEQRVLLHDAGLRATLHRFPGGHTMDAATLLALAGSGD